MSEETVLYACRTANGHASFYPHPKIHRGCGLTDPIDRVRVITDPTGEMWAWWSTEKLRHMFVYGHRQAVEICFPYGSQVDVDRGRGRVVRVRVEVVPAPSTALW